MFGLSPAQIGAICNRDELAFHDFFTKTSSVFFRYVKARTFLSTEEAEDIVSELYIKIRNNCSNYDPNKNREARCWTILKNMIIDHHRKKRESSLELTAEPRSSDPDLVLQTQHRIAINKIENMIAALDELSWLIVHLKLIEWLSYDEIGTIVALNPAAIRKRYSRAISDIKKNPDIAGYLGDE